MQCCCPSPPAAAALLGLRSGRERWTERLYNTFNSSSRDKESDLEKSKEELRGNVNSPSAYFNIINTILGGGIALMTMPTAAQWSGIMLFPIIVFLASALNVYTADLLALGGGLSESPDYASFLGHALGPSWRWISHVLLFLSCLGGSASLVEAAIPLLSIVFSGGSFVIWVVGVSAIGLALMLVLPNMNSLAPLSQVAFGILVVFLCWMIYESAFDMESSSHNGLHLRLWPTSFANVLNATSLILFSLGFQQNVIPIFAGIQEPKRSAWLWSLIFAATTGAICFILSGVLPVIVHPSSYQTVVLQYSGPVFGKVLAFLLGIGFVLSLPLLNVVGILAVFDFLHISHGGSDASLLAESPEMGSFKLQIAKVVFSVLVAAACFLVPGLDNVVTITSAFTQCPLYLILPCIAFHRVSHNTDLDAGVYSFGFLAFLVILASVLWVACLYSLHALT